jgi:UMF1 family MFS transporter
LAVPRRRIAKSWPYDPRVPDEPLDAAVSASPDPSTAAGSERLLRKPVLAWAAWDWGSSAFNAVATTFVFTVWITSKTFVEPGQDQKLTMGLHSEWLGTGMTISGILVALLAPGLGALADASGRRKPWLGWNTLITVLCLGGMVFVVPRQGHLANAVVLGVTLLALGTVFYELASVAYNALLLQITTPAGLGRVSGLGWGAGYVGGIVLLLILFIGFINPDVGWFGVTSEGGWNIRTAMLVATLWMAVFAIPVLVGVRERVERNPQAIGPIGAYKKLGRDIAVLWRTKRSMLGYLVASAVYRDGLTGVFTFGAVLAQGTFGFSSSQVIVFAIAANVVAGIFTIGTGWLDDRFGPRRVILVALVVLVLSATAVLVFHGNGKSVFWAGALVLSACVGPAQSASRGLLARLADEGRETEAFGLYATSGRAATFLAPFAWTVAIAAGGHNQYWGILGITVVLLVGLVLFALVRFPKGRRIDGRDDVLATPEPERV